MVHRPDSDEVLSTIEMRGRAAGWWECLGCLVVLSLGVGLTAQRGKPDDIKPTSESDRRQVARAAARTAERTAAFEREYRKRAAKLERADVVGHFALAKWCAAKQLDRCARWEIHEVLREAPDHVGARNALGQVYANGKWVQRDAAMQARGLVRVDGKWMRPYEAAKLRHRREHALKVQHKANLLFARLADRSHRTRTAARRELEVLAKAESMPKVAATARRIAALYDSYWHRRLTRTGGPVSYTGIVSVNATQSKLLSMDTLSTSLGVGSPVRIQLPRMQTISVGTTVAVPLGIR